MMLRAFLLTLALGLIGIALGLLTIEARSGPYGKLAGEANPPEIRAWYSHVLRPDTLPNPFPCCGEADAYYADGVEVVDGQVYAIITDDRPDCLTNPTDPSTPICRTHEEPGTKYLVPPNKVVGKQAGGNPTGHIIIFLSYTSLNGDKRTQPRDVLCYVQNGGV